MAEFTVENKELGMDTPLTGSLIKNLKSLQIGSGDTQLRVGKDGFYIGNDVYADAPFKISYDGVLTASGAIIRGTINADDITAGTLTGRTVKAVGTGVASDVWLDGSVGEVSFYYGGVKIADLYSDTSGRVLLTSASQSIYITANTDFYCYGNNWFAVSNTDLTSVFNDDGGSDTVRWINDSSLTMEHRDNGDLAISGSYL